MVMMMNDAHMDAYAWCKCPIFFHFQKEIHGEFNSNSIWTFLYNPMANIYILHMKVNYIFFATKGVKLHFYVYYAMIKTNQTLNRNIWLHNKKWAHFSLLSLLCIDTLYTLSAWAKYCTRIVVSRPVLYTHQICAH